MVHTKADALSCAAEMNIEYLVFNGKIIELG
jgi:hypothetical protein